MNINKLIYELKKKIGLVGHLSSVISDRGIKEIIMMSLQEFNRVSSFTVRIPLKPYMNKYMSFNIPLYDYNYNNNIVEIPIADEIFEMCTEHGVEVKEVRLHKDTSVPLVPQTMNMKQDMLSLNASHLRGINTTKPRIKFRKPNLCVIENFTSNITYYQSFMMEMRTTHPETLSTIDIGLERWFEELCRRNIELVLYNNNLRFLNIDMGSIRVELNIENFQNAESEKKELLEQMRSRAAADDMVFYT